MHICLTTVAMHICITHSAQQSFLVGCRWVGHIMLTTLSLHGILYYIYWGRKSE